MSVKPLAQREFPSMLYDTLFGLVLFFSLDSFLKIKDPAHFVFYLFATLVIIHWWLMFKSADDIFAKGIRESAVHILTNITYILLLDFMILYAQDFEYVRAAWFLLAVLALDFLWAWMVMAAGRWGQADARRIRLMKEELGHILRTDGATGILLGTLIVAAPLLAPGVFVGFYVLIYAFFIVLSFRYKIIDLKAV